MKSKIPADFENIALKELRRAWHEFNQEYFKGVMSSPHFELHRGMSRLGLYESTGRTISISRDFISDEAWCRVLGVLKHEMAHQYIFEILQAGDTERHGELFEQICHEKEFESLQLMGMVEVESQAEDRVMDKIRKLLSLAQSDNPHEAEVAMNKANRIMLEWNIKEVRDNAERDFIYLHLGKPGRVNVILRMLSCIIRDYFFVETLWVMSFDPLRDKHGRVLEICGTRDNVEIAEYVYHYLLNIGEMHFKAQKKRDKKTHRSTYIYALLLGFYEKLEQENAKEESASTDLLWLGDPKLKSYFKKRHPHTSSMGSSSMALRENSFEEGHAQGKKVVLHRGIHGKGKGGGRLTSGE